MNQRGEGTGSLRLYAGALVLGMILTGCAGGPSQEDPSWTLVPITDVSMVAGEWEGTVKEYNAGNPGWEQSSSRSTPTAHITLSDSA